MKTIPKAPFLWLAATCFAADAHAADRLTLSVNGSTLTGTDGGAGGAIGWLHDFGPDIVVGVGGEYQTIADASWQFGKISAALTRGPAGKRRSIYAEFHKGNGEDDAHDFTYQSAAAGIILPIAGRLALQLEDKQVDIDTTHGNMPKLGFSMQWSPRLQTALSYAHSVGGNLGTRLTTARLDFLGDSVRLLAGAAVGEADPAVVNLAPGVVLPSRTLREGFAGLARTFSRAELLLLVDYLELGESERVTLTLGCIIPLGRVGTAR
jgi:hypothetical protein